jgi:hypothetical protein
MKQIILFCTCFLIITYAFSQDIKKEDSLNTFHFKLSTGYLSNYLFNGRSDSLKMPYSVTTLEMKNGNGLSFDANLYYLLQNNNQRFDFLELNGSYEHDFTDNFSGGLYATKYFNSSQRVSSNSDISGSLGTGASYDFNIFKLSTVADLLFSSKSDLYLNLELEKEVKWKSSHFTWTFDPTADLNYNSLGYYEGSVTQSSQRRGKKSQNLILQNITSTSVVNPGFRMMDFEIALPITIENEKYGFSFTPTFVNPINPVNTISVINNAGKINTILSTPYSEMHLKSKIFTNISFFIKF